MIYQQRRFATLGDIERFVCIFIRVLYHDSIVLFSGSFTVYVQSDRKNVTLKESPFQPVRVTAPAISTVWGNSSSHSDTTTLSLLQSTKSTLIASPIPWPMQRYTIALYFLSRRNLEYFSSRISFLHPHSLILFIISSRRSARRFLSPCARSISTKTSMIMPATNCSNSLLSSSLKALLKRLRS